MKEVSGGITAAKGFLAAGVHVGVKSSNKTKKDVAIICSKVPAQVGAVFTTNKFAAAPVLWCREVTQNHKAKAIVVNSGNANACTGIEGYKDAEQMAVWTGQALNIPAEQVMVSSTGVIGQRLPMDVIHEGIIKASANLSENGSNAAAEAIMTTDTYKKEIALQYECCGKTITIGGIAKGSGMIHPNMATMLCYITTDVNIKDNALQKAVKEAADHSFNMITVDGDTSTNDTMIVLANGEAGNPVITEGKCYEKFTNALTYLAAALAKMMAHDGEGATKLIEVHVGSAPSEKDAVLAAKAVVSSSLVKSAFFGEDANWGRIICAVGYSGAELDPAKVDMWLENEAGKIQLMAKGAGLAFDEKQASAILKERSINVLIELNMGVAEATAWGCDLSYDYVKINADYRT